VTIALAVSALLTMGAPAVQGADRLVLRVGTTQDLEALNPFNAYQYIGDEVYWINYDFLVGFGGNNEPVPGFADSWSQSPDGKTWTFKIRPGMKWSYGQPATAEDAAWTLQMIIDAISREQRRVGYRPGREERGDGLGDGVRSRTLIELAGERPGALDSVDARSTSGEQDPRRHQQLRERPPVVGTGPYQVSNYWGPGRRRRSSSSSRTRWTMAGAQVGEIDYVATPALQFAQLKRAGHDDDQLDLERLHGLGFNAARRRSRTAVRPKALKDPAFRDARAAIDKQRSSTRSAGLRHVGTTQVPRGSAASTDLTRGPRHRGREAETRRGRLHARLLGRPARQGR
jgi:hypothetical protein